MLDPAAPPLLPHLSDKLVHFVSFLAISLATIGFCRTLRQFLSAGGFCVVAGVALEVAQQLTSARRFEWRDMLANLSGTAVGLVAAMVLLLVLQGVWQRRVRSAAVGSRAKRGARRHARRAVSRRLV